MADVQEDSTLEDFDNDSKPKGCQLSKKLILAIVIPVAVVVLLAIILGLVFGLKKKKSKEVDGEIYTPTYKTVSSAEYYAEILSETERIKPVSGIKNEGYYSKYPVYGSTLREVIGDGEDKVDARNKIIAESGYLVASTGKGEHEYSFMDKDGFLYRGTISEPIPSRPKDYSNKIRSNEQRRLYKHNASVGLYFGNIADTEPGVVKKIILNPRYNKCYSVTGLYAPPGEVIKVELSKTDMDSSGGITFHIGQALNNGQANNIWAGKNQMQRFPIILNTLNINKNTAKLDNKTNTYIGYIGSFLGGPIYVRATKSIVTLTISGAVVYPHFILGVTTPEMFQESLKSSAPYFDLEVWNYGVLHSGPRQYMKSFSYDDLYKAAILWDKVATVTTYKNLQNIVFIYDTFVAAGAAVAFPGRSSVNCPLSWMTNSLNYNSIVTVGTWGNFHEYHHNFQGYGVGNGGEVTNNGLNLVSYALFTKISSNRGIGNYGTQGLDWWTSYTSSIYALNEVLKIKYSNVNPNNGKQGLALYACLLHNFGPDAYIKVKGYGGGQSYSIYMRNWQEITHNNMYYYFKELLDGTDISNNANENYPTFVPIACIYQTGRSYLYYNTTTKKNEKKTFKSMRPFVIPYGKNYDIDLGIYTMSGGQYKSGSILLPTNPDTTTRFNYKIKSFSQPKNGKIKKINDYKYQYQPQENQENLTSGEMIVTLEIKDKKNQIKVDDIDLILELEMSHETLKLTLERTIYKYEPSKMYANAIDAYNNNFKGYKEMKEVDHSNPTQNCNTDIWHYLDTEENREKYPNAPDHYFINNNEIEVLEGKLLFSDNSKYRIYVRGRTNLAVYFSLDGNDYQLGAKITELYEQSHTFKIDKNNTYFDVEYTDDGNANVTTYVDNDEPISRVYKLKPDNNGDIRNWLFFKEVLIDQTQKMASYIGLGYKEWIVASFSTSTTYLDQNNKEVTENNPNVTVIWTNYSDYRAIVVAYKKTFVSDSSKIEYYKPSEKGLVSINENDFSELTKDQIAPPQSTPTYANAYRDSYQFPDNKAFETDYFYKRSYSENYIADPINHKTWDKEVSLISTNYIPEDDRFLIENLFKEGYDNYIHPNANTASGTYYNIDFGREITVNIIEFNGRLPNVATTAQQGFPKNFAIYISNDNIVYTKIGDFVNNDGNGNNNQRSVKVKLNNYYTFRYVNITIASSHSNTGRVILSAINFIDLLDLTRTDDNVIVISSDDVVCTGEWSNKVTYSKFGSVFLGKKGSKIKFEFSGSRLAISTSTKFGSNYHVNIDGNKVDSIQVSKLTREYGFTYLSRKLNDQRHKVEIVCDGEANFDFFASFIDPKY